MEHATAHRSKKAKRVWERHCIDKRTQDAKAAQRLAELEREHGKPISFEQAKAKTRLLSVQ